MPALSASTNEQRYAYDLPHYTFVLSAADHATLVYVLGTGIRLMLLNLGHPEAAEQLRRLAIALREAIPHNLNQAIK